MPAWITSLLRELTPSPIPLSLSTTITSRPARASARATARPMTPAPTTRHLTDSIPQLSAPGGAFLGANIQRDQALLERRRRIAIGTGAAQEAFANQYPVKQLAQVSREFTSSRASIPRHGIPG